MGLLRPGDVKDRPNWPQERTELATCVRRGVNGGQKGVKRGVCGYGGLRGCARGLGVRRWGKPVVESMLMVLTFQELPWWLRGMRIVERGEARRGGW